MFYQLPPVGNPVSLASSGMQESSLLPLFSPCVPYYYACGTAALAAALVAAIAKKGVRNPEVILPAWGCPDLVSAAVYAGARPVLADLEPERPWMALDAVRKSVTDRTVAIVAVDLFGIPERLVALGEIARDAGILLIEDSAQYFPGNDEEPGWRGDLVILSFGRGKPASLLGGGAVLARNVELGMLLPVALPAARASVRDELVYRVKVVLYNLMSLARLYWIPQGLPFLHLGETRYHPLAELGSMSPAIQKRLTANVEAYRADAAAGQRAVAAMLAGLEVPDGGLVDLPAACDVAPDRRLLRYPLLLNGDSRDRVHRQLTKQGLGASVMYPASLPGIPGLESMLSDQGPFPAAEDFAARILTLPVHRQVREQDVRKMQRVLQSSLNPGAMPDTPL